MRSATLNDTLMLGALTGIRSMAGPAAIALHRGGLLARVVTALAAGEMAADKTSFIGNRTDAIPLAGRAAMGAVVGAVIAHDAHTNMFVGGAIGAATAVAAAHLAYQVRTRLPVPSALGGVLEDLVVMAGAARYARGRA